MEEHPASWTFQTVSRTGRMWDLDYSFDADPATLETFTRQGRTLSARGAGRVRIATAGGCRLTATLPFRQPLPVGCTPPRLRISVYPRRVKAGKRISFRFRVTARPARAPRGPDQVRRQARPHQPPRRARIVVRLGRRGRRAARVGRRGMRSGVARVRVR